MDENTILIHFTWDSGPYGVQYESNSGIKIDGPSGYGSNTVPIPADVWERFQAAEEELAEAEKALENAEEEALKTLRANDPRWIAHAAAAQREP